MLLKSSQALAITAVVRLAEVPKGTWLPPGQLRGLLGISQSYFSTLMRLLIEAGIVKRDEREAGGFALARPLNRISLLAIIEAVDGPVGHAPPVELPKAVSGRVEKAVAAGVDDLRKRLAAVTLAG